MEVEPLRVFVLARVPLSFGFGTQVCTVSCCPIFARRSTPHGWTQVMAKNLIALGPEQTTIALVGIFHVDGIERVLMANGWEPQETS